MRSTSFAFAAALALATSVGSGAWAQSYPSKPLRVIVASSAGSNPDTVGRIVASGLAQAFGQQVIVDNRAGAGGNIGAELAGRAPADGYTLFLAHTNHSINATLYRKLAAALRAEQERAKVDHDAIADRRWDAD